MDGSGHLVRPSFLVDSTLWLYFLNMYSSMTTYVILLKRGCGGVYISNEKQGGFFPFFFKCNFYICLPSFVSPLQNKTYCITTLLLSAKLLLFLIFVYSWMQHSPQLNCLVEIIPPFGIWAICCYSPGSLFYSVAVKGWP